MTELRVTARLKIHHGKQEAFREVIEMT